MNQLQLDINQVKSELDSCIDDEIKRARLNGKMEILIQQYSLLSDKLYKLRPEYEKLQNEFKECNDIHKRTAMIVNISKIQCEIQSLFHIFDK